MADLEITHVTYGHVKLHLIQIVQGQLEELPQHGGDLLRNRCSEGNRCRSEAGG